MQFTFSDTDLERMTPDLRSRLYDYLVNQIVPQRVPDEADDIVTLNGFRYIDLDRAGRYRRDRNIVALDGDQAFELHADLFAKGKKDYDRSGDFDDLTKPEGVFLAFGYVDDADAPSPEQVAKKLGLDDPKRLGPYIGSVTNTLKRLTRNSDASLYHFNKTKGVYFVHPKTRRAIRFAFRKALEEVYLKDSDENERKAKMEQSFEKWGFPIDEPPPE